MDFPQEQTLPLLVHTGMAALGGLGDGRLTSESGTSIVISPQNGTVIYAPMIIPWPYTVARVFWMNGSTVTTGENDFGIYSTGGSRLYHTGKKTLSGASQTQFVALGEPFVLSPGEYYFALFYSGTVTSRWFGISAVESARLAGYQAQISQVECPATASFISAQAPMPICGVTRTSAGF